MKKDLRNFERKRAQYSISNLKLPELDSKDLGKYQPIKSMKPVDNSASLNYNRAQANFEKRNALNIKDAGSLDAVIKNIRETLINGTKKLKTVTPDFID